jgi:transglutaminase-like putative cysteine protease
MTTAVPRVITERRPSRGGAPKFGFVAANIAVATTAVVLAMAPIIPAFGASAVLPALLGGALLGALVVALAALRRWHVVVTIAATMITYLVFGGALAAPNTTKSGVLPTADTFVTLAKGIVTSWKQILTLEPPLGQVGATLVAPYALGLVAVVAAGTVACSRTTTNRGTAIRVALTAAIVCAVLALSILLGTLDAPITPVIGCGLAVLILVWAAWRRGRWRPQRAPSMAIMAAVAIGGGIVMAPFAASDTPRFVLRSVVVPPFDPRDYASPLSAYRAFIKDDAETALLTVSALPEDAVVRLATMDSYDGVVWNVGVDNQDGSGAFRSVGDTISTSTTGASASVEVTIQGLEGPWLPTVGDTTGISFDGDDATRNREAFQYNDATGTAALSTGLASGQSYTLDAVVPSVPTDEEIGDAQPGSVGLSKPQSVPEIVATRASEIVANSTSPALAARSLETYLHDSGFFSHGDAVGGYPSLAGHSAFRMNHLFGDDFMVGDAEQYAAAMALMASEQGLPSRVVIGFVPTEEQRGQDSITFTGADVQAWTEINFAGIGWVAYYPTPPTSQTPQEADQPVQQDPQPQVIQPPPPPADSETPPEDEADDPEVQTPEEETTTSNLGQILMVSAAVGGTLLILLLPFVLILALKARRRRRRRAAAEPAQRISGGWREVLDTARDFGTEPPADATRRETARSLVAAFPAVEGTVLAVHADAAVFAAQLPDDADAAEYWGTVDEATAAIRSDGSTWRRLRGAASLRSLRRGRRKRLKKRSAGAQR